MTQINPQRNHYELVSLKQSALLLRIWQATGVRNIVLWEMVGLNDIYEEIRAGSITAGKLGINKGETIGYRIISGHQKGGAIGDLLVEEPNQPPPINDIIGNLRWRARLTRK